MIRGLVGMLVVQRRIHVEEELSSAGTRSHRIYTEGNLYDVLLSWM